MDESYEAPSPPRRFENPSRPFLEHLMRGALPAQRPSTPITFPRRRQSVEYDGTRDMVNPFHRRSDEATYDGAQSPSLRRLTEKNDVSATARVSEDSRGSIPDEGEGPFFCPIHWEKPYPVINTCASHFKHHHGTLPNGSTSFLSMFATNTMHLIKRPIVMSEFRLLESLHTEKGFGAVIQWLNEHPNVTEDPKETAKLIAQDIEQTWGKFFDDVYWRDNTLIPWAQKLVSNFYPGLRLWKTARGTPPRLRSSETEGGPQLTNCMPYRGAQPDKPVYPGAAVQTTKTFEANGRRISGNRLLWLKLAACRVDRSAFLAYAEGKVEISHSCICSDCLNMDHGHVEPLSLNQLRRSCMKQADEHGRDFCVRHKNDPSGPCRLYTFDKPLEFWLGIPDKAKGKKNKKGRFDCGHSKCKVSEAREYELRRHWMEKHTPDLVEEQANKPIEVSDDDESGEEYSEDDYRD
ncbi:hypothetical protein KC356_g7765 [Hortaea werneckii]|nr:hypothetical protein KC356_g7765 [Hortaea werneckii]